MRANTVESRRELLKLRNLGVSLADAVKEFSEKYIVSKRTVYLDRDKRGDWMKDLIEIDDPETMLLETLAIGKSILSPSWSI